MTLTELTIRPPLVGHVHAEVISDRDMELVFDGVGGKVAIHVHPATDVATTIGAAVADALRVWDAQNAGSWSPSQRDVERRTKVRVLRPGWEGTVGTVFWCHPSGDRMRVYTATNPSMLLFTEEVEPLEADRSVA